MLASYMSLSRFLMYLSCASVDSVEQEAVDVS